MAGEHISEANKGLGGFSETLRNILNGFQDFDKFISDFGCFIQGHLFGNWCS